jgi:hypothetical protein
MTCIIQTEHYPSYVEGHLDRFVADLVLLHARQVGDIDSGQDAAHPLDLVPPRIERAQRAHAAKCVDKNALSFSEEIEEPITSLHRILRGAKKRQGQSRVPGHEDAVLAPQGRPKRAGAIALTATKTDQKAPIAFSTNRAKMADASVYTLLTCR